MIARSFCLAFMRFLRPIRGSSARSKRNWLSPAVAGLLQPRLRGSRAIFPRGDLVRVLEREPDVIEALEQAHAIGGRNLEGDVGATGTADALGRQVDGKGRR